MICEAGLQEKVQLRAMLHKQYKMCAMPQTCMYNVGVYATANMHQRCNIM